MIGMTRNVPARAFWPPVGQPEGFLVAFLIAFTAGVFLCRKVGRLSLHPLDRQKGLLPPLLNQRLHGAVMLVVLLRRKAGFLGEQARARSLSLFVKAARHRVSHFGQRIIFRHRDPSLDATRKSGLYHRVGQTNTGCS
jgi:hypothetical protein